MANFSLEQAAVEGAARGVRRAVAAAAPAPSTTSTRCRRRRGIDRAQQRSRRDPRAHRQGAGDGAPAERVPRRGRRPAKRGSRASRPILPEEKDAADLLRRVNTLAVAVEPDDPRLPPAGDHHQADCTPSGRSASSSRARITTSGMFLDRVSKFPRIINVGGLDIDGRPNSDAEPTATVEVTCTATTFVLLDRRPRRAAPQEGRAAAREENRMRLLARPVSSSPVGIAAPRARRRPPAPPRGRGRRQPRRRRPRRRRRRTTPTRPEGRRDPFVSLINRSGTSRGAAPKARRGRKAIAGILVDEVVVRGISQTRGDLGRDDCGAQRADLHRFVRAIGSWTATSARSPVSRSCSMQDVNDPLSLEKQREVRKHLRGEVK